MTKDGSIYATALHRHCTTWRTRPPDFGADRRHCGKP
jgi:hypothetical protein